MVPKPSSRDAQLAAELKKEVVSAMSADTSLTPQAAMKKITKEMLVNNPFVTPAGCPVNTLPPELLAHIFLVGTEMEAQGEFEEDEDEDEDDFDLDMKDGWTDEEDVDPDVLDSSVVAKLKSKGKVEQRADGAMDVDGDEDSEEDEDEERDLPFQVLVSHVCRHWREVAIETPALWTTLTFTEGAPFEKSIIWIQRAKSGPLDIHLDCTFDGYDEDDEDNDDAPGHGSNGPNSIEPVTPALHGHQYATEHAHCIHEPPALSFLDFKQILDIIIPLVAQWRSLEVTTSVWEYMYTLLARLSECPSAPLLEALELDHYDDIEDEETFSPAEFKEPFLIFNGNAPNLRDVVLWGVHLDWDRSLTLLSNLHELKLAYHTEDVRPSFTTFTQIIASSPNLHNLSLCLSGPKRHDLEENNWGTDSIEIPSLKDLLLSYHKPSYAVALIKKISVPNVHGLALDFDGEDYSDFVKQLALPMSKTNKSILAGVEHMKISGLPCNRTSMELMLAQLVGLKSLQINCMGEEEHEIFRQLLPAKMAAGGSTTPKQSVYCPNLNNITTTGISGSEMRQFVEARKAADVPIKWLTMRDEDEVKEQDLSWLRDNVEEVMFVESSDTEDEFVEEIDEADFGAWDDDDDDLMGDA